MTRRRAASAASAVARALLDLAAARPRASPRPAARIVPRSLAARRPRASSPRDDDDDARSSPPTPAGRRPASAPAPSPPARLVRSGERIGGDARQDAALRHLSSRDELVAAFDDDDADDEAAAASRRASMSSASFRRRPLPPPSGRVPPRRRRPREKHAHGHLLRDAPHASPPPLGACARFMAEPARCTRWPAPQTRRRRSRRRRRRIRSRRWRRRSSRGPLVCFDEVELSDVADALVFKRLFERAFDYGGVFVATSNCAPDQLYAGGISRDRFAPFADVLRERCEIVSLDEEEGARVVSETANRAATHPKASTGIRTDPEPERDASACPAGVDYRAARYEKSIASSRGEGGAARLPASRAKEGPAEGGPVHTPEGGFGFDDDWQQMMCGPLVEEEVPLTGGRTVPARVGRVSGADPDKIKNVCFVSVRGAVRARRVLSAGDYALLATAFSAVRIEGAPGVRGSPSRTRTRRGGSSTSWTCCTSGGCWWRISRRRPAALRQGAGGNVPPGAGRGAGAVRRARRPRASVGVVRLRGGGNRRGTGWNRRRARRCGRRARWWPGRVGAGGRRGREQRAALGDGRGDGVERDGEAGRRAR